MINSNLTRIFAVALLLGSSCGTVFADGEAFTGFADDFNSRDGLDGVWSIIYDDRPGNVELIADPDSVGNRYVRISSDGRTAKGVKHKLTGLKPATLYRISARVKADSVSEGRGAVLYVNPENSHDQPWNASEFVYGSCGWKPVYMDFISDFSGDAEVVLALGFPWGTYNGGTAKGTVCWDDVKVVETPADAVKRREGKHLAFVFDSDKVTIDDRQLDSWLGKLDKAYESYSKLVGDAPYDGRKITILMTPGIEAGYWALAGNPILWNNHVDAGEQFGRIANENDWNFGILHEIGHTFSAGSIGKSGNWNWNDELFANFRMSYALEKRKGNVAQGSAMYKGAEIKNYYKTFYENTLGKGKATDNGDALHYTFLRIKDKYGWKVYEKAFRSLYGLGDNDIAADASGFDKFMFFLKHVSDAAGEDVVAATYTEEEIRLIKEGMGN